MLNPLKYFAASEPNRNASVELVVQDSILQLNFSQILKTRLHLPIYWLHSLSHAVETTGVRCQI